MRFRAVAVLTLAASALSASALSAQTPPVSSAATAPLLRGMRVTPDVTMRLYVPAGRVRITTWARDSVAVRGTVAASGSFFGGGSRTHAKFGIEARQPGDTALPSAVLDVVVPRAARLWVKMIDGSIDASGTTGELELYTVRGTMVVTDVRGVCSVESIDAPITLRRASGDVRLRGSRGGITVEQMQGTLSVATVSGPVRLNSVAADGRVETIGGDIVLDGPRLAGRSLELQSHAGAITLQLDRTRTPLLDLSSRAGPVLGDAVKGQATHGTLTARSFKGRIRVIAR